jgi:hypothetical protein
MANQVVQVGYSKETSTIELTVPRGTKTADMHKIMATVFTPSIIGHLPGRGCQTCTSGDHLLVREALENVIRVDLDKKAVIGA